MAKDTRPYIKVTLDMPDHPKYAALSKAQKFMVIEGWIHCAKYRTDGHMDKHVWAKFGRKSDRIRFESNGIVKQNGDGNGVVFIDFLDHQRSRAEMEERQEKARSAGQMGGKAKAANGRVEPSETLATARPLLSIVPSKNLPEVIGKNITTSERSIEAHLETSPELRSDVEELCSELVRLKAANGCVDTEISEGWRTAARLLLDKDQVPLPAALTILRWSQADSFWKSNILSMPKFRSQFDQLRMKAEQSGVKMPLSDEAIREWLRQCWKDASVQEIQDRASVYYDRPDPPEGLDVQGLKTFTRDHRRDWIDANRELIITKILAKESSAA